jgi:glutathione synthase/RimK-type ligase-like ATP-grasp enzyme
VRHHAGVATTSRPRPAVALATCALVPDLDDDEGLVIPALAKHGVVAVPAVWDDRSVDWDRYDLVVVRSAWDYAERRAEFLEWTASLARVLNSHAVLEWNTDKVYLRDLASRGIRVVPTIWAEPGDDAAALSLPDGDLVVKPAVSAGARNTARYRAQDQAVARIHVDRLLAAGRTVMVQPYVGSVDVRGETALLHFAGVYSHAINKGPLLTQPGRITEGLWEPERISAAQPADDERALAEAVLDALPWPRHELLYARVDVVRGADGRPEVLELELAEPSLFLGQSTAAAERFADAIVHRLDGS